MFSGEQGDEMVVDGGCDAIVVGEGYGAIVVGEGYDVMADAPNPLLGGDRGPQPAERVWRPCDEDRTMQECGTAQNPRTEAWANVPRECFVHFWPWVIWVCLFDGMTPEELAADIREMPDFYPSSVFDNLFDWMPPEELAAYIGEMDWGSVSPYGLPEFDPGSAFGIICSELFEQHNALPTPDTLRSGAETARTQPYNDGIPPLIGTNFPNALGVVLDMGEKDNRGRHSIMREWWIGNAMDSISAWSWGDIESFTQFTNTAPMWGRRTLMAVIGALLHAGAIKGVSKTQFVARELLTPVTCFGFRGIRVIDEAVFVDTCMCLGRPGSFDRESYEDSPQTYGLKNFTDRKSFREFLGEALAPEMKCGKWHHCLSGTESFTFVKRTRRR